MQQRRGRTSNAVTSGRSPTLRLRPLEFEPDLVRRDLYDLEIENVTDPALHTLFRAKRDEIARQITALEDRDTSRFVYGSLQLYGGIAQPLASAAEELLETIPARGSQHPRASRPGRSRKRLVRSSIDTAPCIRTSRRTSRCATTSPN